MTEPGPHGPQRSRARLTVARAAEAERRALREQVTCPVVGVDALEARAVEVAAAHAGERAAVRQRAAAAVQRSGDAVALAADRHSQLREAHQGLQDGAEWVAGAGDELAAAQQAVDEAAAVVEARQAEQRRAMTDLDRVIEQRATANAAMADAEQQLVDLGVSELDESGLRRELEASGQAVRHAQDAHTAAVAALQDLQARAAAAEVRHAEVVEALAAQDRPEAGLDEVATVQAALDRWDGAAALAGPDPTAAALADAWNDLHADLATVTDTTALPDATVLAAAEARVIKAADELAALEAAAGAGAMTAEARAELDAAHEAVQRLEERGQRRLGAGAARRELDEARQREEELLARYGFASYIDVVLTGGKARRDTPELLQAARTLRTAVAERERLQAAAAARPELAYLEGERARLHDHCTQLLGVDPGDHVIGLLLEHPEVPALVVQDLRSALESVGVRPVGVSLRTAAHEWLVEQESLTVERERRAERAERLRREVADLEAERAGLVAEIAAAERTVQDAAVAVDRATRSVSAFESELSMRVDEDARRLRRFAAAEQLRAQVEALSVTLARAEADARSVLERTARALAVAEQDLDQATTRVTELTRRVRSLAGQLPADRRLDTDPMLDLEGLRAGLLEAAERMVGDLRSAQAAQADAEAALDATRAELLAAEARADGPQPEDRLEALQQLVATGTRVLVLDEPFAALAPEQQDDARQALVHAVEQRPVVLLTADPDLLGWAIELPSSIGGIVPVDALNLAGADADDPTEQRAIVELSDAHDPPVDAAPTTRAPRWAGRR